MKQRFKMLCDGYKWLNEFRDIRMAYVMVILLTYLFIVDYCRGEYGWCLFNALLAIENIYFITSNKR